MKDGVKLTCARKAQLTRKSWQVESISNRAAYCRSEIGSLKKGSARKDARRQQELRVPIHFAQEGMLVSSMCISTGSRDLLTSKYGFVAFVIGGSACTDQKKPSDLLVSACQAH